MAPLSGNSELNYWATGFKNEILSAEQKHYIGQIRVLQSGLVRIIQKRRLKQKE